VEPDARQSTDGYRCMVARPHRGQDSVIVFTGPITVAAICPASTGVIWHPPRRLHHATRSSYRRRAIVKDDIPRDAIRR